MAFLRHESVTPSLAWETREVIDQLNKVIKMKQSGNGGNAAGKASRDLLFLQSGRRGDFSQTE